MTQLKQNEHALEIRDLSIAFGGLKAVDALSFTIEQGEIFGLIGPNGAGKTTVFNCITQFYKADHGEILYRNKKNEIYNLMELPVHNVIHTGIVRTFQNVELIKELSILENVLIGAHHNFRAPLLGQLLHSRFIRQEEQEYRERAMEILAFLEIADLKDYLAGSQPYGVQKKVELARTLITSPDLIILDEPAAGLNDSETRELADQILKIRDTYGVTILLVEHDMRLVMKICDHVCAISFGRRIAVGTPKEIQLNPDVQKAYLGEEGELG